MRGTSEFNELIADKKTTNQKVHDFDGFVREHLADREPKELVIRKRKLAEYFGYSVDEIVGYITSSLRRRLSERGIRIESVDEETAVVKLLDGGSEKVGRVR